MALLKKLTYACLIVYLTVYYGQEYFDFGSFERKYFLFVGMSIFSSLISFALFKLLNNIATKYLLYFNLGVLFNNAVCFGEYHELELIFVFFATIHLVFEKQINKIVLKWKK